MILFRLKEIQDRFKNCLDLQKECQQELVTMQFTERELKEIIDITGDLIFIKKNEEMIAKALASSAYGKCVTDCIERSLNNELDNF